MRTVFRAAFAPVMTALALVYAGHNPANAQQWAGIAPLPTARGALAAATATDGRVFAFGGYGDGGIFGSGFLNRVDAYNPVSNSWQAASPMPNPRAGLAAATGADGAIYLFGGWNGPLVSVVDRYDPITNTWSTVASLGTQRSYPAAVLGANGKIYVLGGFVPEGVTASVEVFDPATNGWTSTAPMIVPRGGLAAATGPDGRIYVMGGYTYGGDTPAAEVYDPASNSWMMLPNMPTRRGILAAAAGPDGRIYAIGGYSFLLGWQSAVEAYDPQSNAWSVAAPLAGPRNDLAATVGSNGRIYAVGGYSPAVGYVSTAESLTFDKTAPNISTDSSASEIWPPNGKLVPITITGTMSDGVSGVDTTTANYKITDEYGTVQPSGMVAVQIDGSFTFTVSLEARRRGNDTDGRLYQITITCADKAGNLATLTVNVTVVHDQG